jgi:hypothetical protein
MLKSYVAKWQREFQVTYLVISDSMVEMKKYTEMVNIIHHKDCER